MARRGLTKQSDIEAAISGTETPRPSNDEIAQRAFGIYEREGRIEGRDIDHWLRAEAELLTERQNGNRENHSTANGNGRNEEAPKAQDQKADRGAPRRTLTPQKTGV